MFYSLRTTLAFALFVMCPIPASAFCLAGYGNCEAQAIGDTLETFGLIGKWSQDCGNDSAPRLIYRSVPPSYEKISGNATVQLVTKWDIISAALVTADKLKYVAITRAVILNGREANAQPQRLEAVYQKEGQKFRLIDWTLSYQGFISIGARAGIQYVPDPSDPKHHMINSGSPTTPIERCLN